MLQTVRSVSYLNASRSLQTWHITQAHNTDNLANNLTVVANPRITNCERFLRLRLSYGTCPASFSLPLYCLITSNHILGCNLPVSGNSQICINLETLLIAFFPSRHSTNCNGDDIFSSSFLPDRDLKNPYFASEPQWVATLHCRLH